MKQPSELTREELEQIVGQVRDILWLDSVSGALDPDRSWDSETIEWVSGVLEDAGLKPDPVRPSSPATDDPPVVAMRAALEAFIATIEATGGCIRPGRADVGTPDEALIALEDERPVPAADEDWLDLADAYLLACRALGREPMVQDADDDELVDDVELTSQM
jgi:hypothetical protein